MAYKEAWDWIKSNRSAPFSTVVYVSAIAIVVKIKNIFTSSGQRVMVEMYNHANELPFTVHFFPRICLIERQRFDNFLAELMQKVTMPEA